MRKVMPSPVWIRHHMWLLWCFVGAEMQNERSVLTYQPYLKVNRYLFTVTGRRFLLWISLYFTTRSGLWQNYFRETLIYVSYHICKPCLCSIIYHITQPYASRYGDAPSQSQHTVVPLPTDFLYFAIVAYFHGKAQLSYLYDGYNQTMAAQIGYVYSTS